jgi:hypothetical protein
MLYQLLIFALMSLAAFANSLADERCPTISEIKEGLHDSYVVNGWLPLYRSNEELALPKDIENFREHVEESWLAEWSTYNLEAGHCYYKGSDSMVYAIVLAKDEYRPANSYYWHWLEPNKIAHCFSANPDNCLYL